MTQPPSDPPELAGAIRSSWRRFLDVYEPLRPELYRYCRQLCRSAWDADDLVQDALARAFAMLGTLDREPENPRAWLFRVASNAWIDRVRRQREVLAPRAEAGTLDADPSQASEPRAAREAAATLIEQLSPQERAAVVLKDVFELSLDETALALGTSVGAVKAASTRGWHGCAIISIPLTSSRTCAPRSASPSARTAIAPCEQRAHPARRALAKTAAPLPPRPRSLENIR